MLYVRLCISQVTKRSGNFENILYAAYLKKCQFIWTVFNSIQRLHKNRREEQPGWNAETIRWCLEKATQQSFSGSDFWGGLVIDEMKIQVQTSN